MSDKMNIADLDLINELLENVTGYQISKDTGINEMTISRWRTGKTPTHKMSLEHGIKLTNYAKAIKKDKQ